MFAAATREVVFSNPEVIQRIKQDFIPVALKAGLVNNPPLGLEGELYAEIKRTSPAPQGICTINSDGRVLAWALSFRHEDRIADFLDFAAQRYQEYPDRAREFPAVRFMVYPDRELAEVTAAGTAFDVPDRHSAGVPCPAVRSRPTGTLAGRIIGRALDDQGRPLPDATRQEHYMESRFEISTQLQAVLARAAIESRGARFLIPHEVARAMVAPAYLGQLDVSPLGNVPGSRNESQWWRFQGELAESESDNVTRLRVTGRSNIAGGQMRGTKRGAGDGRVWEHDVALDWQGYIELQQDRIVALDLVAAGRERLKWGHGQLIRSTEPDAAHLMAGHPINLECQVRYALRAQ